MSLAKLLRHPCGICEAPIAWGARWCPHCGGRGVLITYGPGHIQARHWVFAFVLVVVPFLAILVAVRYP